MGDTPILLKPCKCLPKVADMVFGTGVPPIVKRAKSCVWRPTRSGADSGQKIDSPQSTPTTPKGNDSTHFILPRNTLGSEHGLAPRSAKKSTPPPSADSHPCIPDRQMVREKLHCILPKYAHEGRYSLSLAASKNRRSHCPPGPSHRWRRRAVLGTAGHWHTLSFLATREPHLLVSSHVVKPAPWTSDRNPTCRAGERD